MATKSFRNYVRWRYGLGWSLCHSYLPANVEVIKLDFNLTGKFLDELWDSARQAADAFFIVDDKEEVQNVKMCAYN